MLNLVHVRSLVTVLHTGSFGEAARRLGLAQPTVSQHVKKLECRLDVVLVARSPGGSRPTDAARALLPLAKNLLRLHDRLVEDARERRLTIGASSNIGTYLLQPLLGRYRGACPEQPLEVVIEPNPVIAERLESGEVDLALMEWWDRREGFRARRWQREELVVIVPNGHPWAGRDVIEPADLDGVELLAGEPGTGTGRLLRAYLAGSGGTARVGLTLGNTEAVKRAVIHGLGISLVFAGAVEQEVRAGLLHALPLADAGLAKDLYAIWPRHLDDNARLAAFRELLHVG